MLRGKKIAELRKARKMSQEDLADAMQVSRQAVSKWENGQSNPDTENLIRLANVLNVDVGELVQNQHCDEKQTTEGRPCAEEAIEAGRKNHVQRMLLILMVCTTVLFAGLWLQEKYGNTDKQLQETHAMQWDSVKFYTEDPFRTDVVLTSAQQRELSDKIWNYYFTKKVSDVETTKIPCGGMQLFVEFRKQDYTHVWCFTTHTTYHVVIMDNGEYWHDEYEADYNLLSWLKMYIE